MGNTNPNEVFGHRLTRITENSPASGAELEIYTDFIIDILEKPKQFNLETDFHKLIADFADRTIHFKIYSILTRETRTVPLVPTKDWPNADGLLGLKTRFESVTAAAENVYRITGVKNPDLFDRIKIQDEFFLAVTEFPFADLEDLKRQLILHTNIHLVLFSLQTHRVRIMSIDIGPSQGLGFEISTGVLHDLTFILKNSQKSLDKEVGKEIRFGNIEKNSLFRESAPEIEMVSIVKQTSETKRPEIVNSRLVKPDENNGSTPKTDLVEKATVGQNDWGSTAIGEGDFEDEDLASVNL
jgi:hypothetical protein